VRDLAEACDIANRIAPEHLELSVAEPQRWIEKIRHAGAGRHPVFVSWLLSPPSMKSGFRPPPE